MSYEIITPTTNLDRSKFATDKCYDKALLIAQLAAIVNNYLNSQSKCYLVLKDNEVVEMPFVFENNNFWQLSLGTKTTKMYAPFDVRIHSATNRASLQFVSKSQIWKYFQQFNLIHKTHVKPIF